MGLGAAASQLEEIQATPTKCKDPTAHQPAAPVGPAPGSLPAAKGAQTPTRGTDLKPNPYSDAQDGVQELSIHSQRVEELELAIWEHKFVLVGAVSRMSTVTPKQPAKGIGE